MMDFIREIEMIGSKYLAEAKTGLDYSHNKLGETGFTKTDGSEFYIQQIIQDYADTNKITLGEAQAKFDEMSANALSNMEKSPKINGTMMSNIAESIAFQMLEETEITDVKFEKRVFQEIFQELKSEVPEFYPLSNVFEPKRVEPRIFYTPDPLTPEFASIGTAACTPDAKLIFNVPFMEKLMKFAQVKGIKADPNKLHGKKYESQGGNIPDSYLYCEFVLMHEIMHYGNGDFFFEKAYNLNGNLVNYVGDFVTNYNLVKSGYAQLPIGLFNDEINYDRYPSFQQMYDVVEEEMKKLSDQDQQDMMDQLDKMGDEMPKDGEGADPQQGQSQQGQSQQGQSQQGQSQQGQSQQGQQQEGGKSGEGQGSDGDSSSNGQSAEEKKKEAAEAEARAKAAEAAEDAGKSSGKAPSDSKSGKKKKKIPDSIDKAIKDNQQTQADAQSDTGRETKTGMNPNAAKPGDLADMMSGQNNGTGTLSADGNPYELAERQYKPKLNWKQLLKKMVPSGTDKDETYSKPSRRTTSSMVSIAQTGVGAVKPGTKEVDSKRKGLCFVLDESGSTMDKIGEMKASILKLMEKNKKQLNGTMYMIKFSNDIHMYKIDLKKMKYGRIINYNDFINNGKIDVKCTKNARDLFKSSYGGGTELNSKVANIVKKLKTKLNFNTIIFSDSDIAYGSNAETLKTIYKQLGSKAFALIGCDKDDYEAFAKLLGDKQNITHF